MGDILTITNENMHTKLKIKPRICENCGEKYIPTGRTQKYCPECRKAIFGRKDLSKAKKLRDYEHAKRNLELEAQRIVLSDQEAQQAEQPAPDTDPVTVTVTPEELEKQEWETIEVKPDPEADAIEDELGPEAAKTAAWVDAVMNGIEEQQRTFADQMREMVEEGYGIELIDKNDIQPCLIRIGNEVLFDGYARVK